MLFSKGDKVTQVLPAPIAGTVEGFALDQTTGTVTVLVSYTEAGKAHKRYFKESELAK